MTETGMRRASIIERFQIGPVLTGLLIAAGIEMLIAALSWPFALVIVDAINYVIRVDLKLLAPVQYIFRGSWSLLVPSRELSCCSAAFGLEPGYALAKPQRPRTLCRYESYRSTIRSPRRSEGLMVVCGADIPVRRLCSGNPTSSPPPLSPLRPSRRRSLRTCGGSAPRVRRCPLASACR
jgi:hypothetical protein